MSNTIWRVTVAFAVCLAAALGVTMTPAAAASTSIWTAAATPAGSDSDASAVELGVRFQSDKNGYITGVRFYKYASNTGTHVGNLWSNAGALLATATFTAETASGWQQVDFATPVLISANTTYVVSYHTNTGHYAANSNYFAAGIDNASLHALADGIAGGNGVYRYGAASAFPNASWQATNYWVDVVFAASAPSAPLTVVSVTPAAGATGVSTTSLVTASITGFLNYSSVNTATFELRDSANNLVPASVGGGGETQTFTLSPTSPLAFNATYTAKVKGGATGIKDLSGNPMAADYTWSFSTGAAPSPPPPVACPCSIWSAASTTPAGPEADTSPVELGVRFRSDTSGYITGVRFYKFASNTGAHTGSLWTNTGTRLAAAAFRAETASGWQQVTFDTPVAIAANTTYVASYHADAGHYAANSGYFAAAFDNPPLHALRDGVDGSNGVYRYSATAFTFPDQTYLAANYWVDVVFLATLPPDVTPPTVVSTFPSAGGTAIETNVTLTATFSESMDPATINGNTVELRDASGALVPASVAYSVPNGTAILRPTNAMAIATTYTVTVKGGTVDPRAKDLAGNALAANYSWTFTTVGLPPPPPTGCPCTLWSASTIPAVIDTDSSAVEVGVRFNSEAAGYITGVRFYKGSENIGLHIASLWTNTGALLARETFVGESGSGWQQVNFPLPVPIEANTTYVASYHTDVGRYAVNGGYFANASLDNPPLHAPRNGLAGANGVYVYSASSAFPFSSFNSANYWVDVVYRPTFADMSPPRILATTPAAGATGVAATSVVTASFSKDLHRPSLNTTTFQLRDSAGNLVPASVGGGESTKFTLAPTSALAFNTTYTATVKGTVTDPSGQPMGADYSWSFTTASGPPPPPAGCPCSIWDDLTVPSRADSDMNSISIGVKFRSNAAGYITALRFYKFPENVGTHVGELWTSTGTRLAVVTFANETASGWQQVMLWSPVAIAANTTYVASYHADFGRYAVNSQYFAATGVTNGPLHALANGEDGGNGVYRYGPVGSFPNLTFQGENYWVDVLFSTSPPDTTAPTVTSVTPPIATVAVPRDASVSATFSEAMNAATISTATFELRDPSGAVVPATVAYNTATRTATLVPSALLNEATMYTASVKGGATDPRVKDVAGNALATNSTWVFTTVATPSTLDGPGGPVLIITSTSNPYSRYYAEILRAEGLNEFAVRDISTVTSNTLIAYNLAILGEMPLTAAQATMLGSWANGGGNLIAMRPDKKLATLLGLTDLSSTLTDGYMLVDRSSKPAAGIVGETMQFHGAADLYALNGAASVATLYSGTLAATSSPAVTLRHAQGANGGYNAAFTYDLARSIVQTRQGNPAWASQDRDGFTPIRTNDLFFGASSTDGQADWINLDKVAIPQSDEQQRLFVNLIVYMNQVRKPLPRFWYLPHGHNAVVVMTGEDHVNGHTAGRFDGFKAASPPGCSVENWECVRATSYLYPTTAIDAAAAAAYQADGFEIGVHVSTNCGDWTPEQLSRSYTDQLNAFAARFPGLAAPATQRVECSAWTDYATQPQVELTHGIRLDASYEYWPSSWVADRPGFFTGSGMPMRLVDANGALVDVYQSATAMTDESGQTYPATIDTLLDNALGPKGYYGVFTVAIHGDSAASETADAIVASAQSRGVPVISARQLLEWLDGRNGSSFRSISWNGSWPAATLSFSVDMAAGAGGLHVMVPTHMDAPPTTLTSLTLNGNAVASARRTIKGIEYAIFPVAAGSYQATYTP